MPDRDGLCAEALVARASASSFEPGKVTTAIRALAHGSSATISKLSISGLARSLGAHPLDLRARGLDVAGPRTTPWESAIPLPRGSSGPASDADGLALRIEDFAFGRISTVSLRARPRGLRGTCRRPRRSGLRTPRRSGPSCSRRPPAALGPGVVVPAGAHAPSRGRTACRTTAGAFLPRSHSPARTETSRVSGSSPSAPSRRGGRPRTRASCRRAESPAPRRGRRSDTGRAPPHALPCTAPRRRAAPPLGSVMSRRSLLGRLRRRRDDGPVDARDSRRPRGSGWPEIAPVSQ